jgi:trigger factor
MTITVEQQPKSQVKLTIEVSVEEMKPYLEKAAETLSSQYKIEGFRPGKASLGIVIGKLGAQVVWEEAAEFAVRKTFVQAVREKNLMTIGQPHIHMTKLAPENPLIYTAESAVLPTVELGDYASFKTKKTKGVVKAEDIDKAVNELRDMFATEALVEREAKMGDKVNIDIELHQDNVAVEGGATKDHPVLLGSGHFIPGFEEQMVGVKKDESKKFTLTFPKEYHNAKLAGKPGEFTVKVNGVYEIIKPELNDDLAKKAGKFASFDELKKKLEENLQSEADDKEDAAFERAVIDEFIGKSKFGDLPEMLINSELEKMLHELQDQVTQQGGKWEDYLTAIKKSADDLKKEFMPQAEKRVKAALLIREVAKKEQIVADPKQIDEEIASTKQMYQQSPEILERIDSEDYRDYLGSMQVNKKVVELLKARATTPTK